MADLNELQSAGATKIVGSTTLGAETNPLTVNADGSINVTDNGSSITVDDGLNSGGVQGQLTLTLANTAYEAKVGVSALSNRKMLIVTALDDMYWGFSNTVTASTGTPVYKNQQITFAINPSSGFQIWLIASTASRIARIAESP